MRTLALILALLWSLSADAATQPPLCTNQNDVVTVIANAKSTTVSTATFNFNDLTTLIVLKTATLYPRVFTSTTLPAAQQFALTTTPDAYWSSYQRQYHESLLAQTRTQICPLLTGGTSTSFLLTH
jgi:hypothetical protein